jgi:hypothetical protein
MKLSKKLTVNIKSSHHNSSFSSSSSCMLPDPVLTQKISNSPPGSAEENLQQHMRMRVGFSYTSEEEQQELVTHT